MAKITECLFSCTISVEEYKDEFAASIRKETIKWLTINRDNGFFDGFDEENMDFEDLGDEELLWYYYEWVCPDRSICKEEE